MARTIVSDDAEKTVWLVTSDDIPPDQTGGWWYEETDWKPGTPQANEAALRDKASAALTANSNDLAQDATISNNAAAVIGTSGTLTTAQLSNIVRQLAQAVSLLAHNDVNTKKELNALIRLLLDQCDSLVDT